MCTRALLTFAMMSCSSTVSGFINCDYSMSVMFGTLLFVYIPIYFSVVSKKCVIAVRREGKHFDTQSQAYTICKLCKLVTETA